jgi:hypothetical protein
VETLFKEDRMKQRFEHKFVRVGEGWFGARSKTESEYRRIIQEHAVDGWRLVQIFAPSTGVYGASRYFEIILERETGGLKAKQGADGGTAMSRPQ